MYQGELEAFDLFKLLIFLNIEAKLIKNIMSQNKEDSSKRTSVSKGTDLGKTGGSREAVSKGTDLGKTGGSREAVSKGTDLGKSSGS